MLGLTKVNDNWVPLQAKVFSRWVSSQLKDVDQIEIQDVQKDLSNGVALVELASVLTQKPPSRAWTHSPKLKVEMVQNCDLALDMFTKDGVNFVGISGKDISDNNQKLILGLIWTLILHYSVNKSVNINEETTIINSKENRNSKENKENKIEQRINSKAALETWAIERTENYPHIHNFSPYDLSLCALLDSYFPQRINYYSLNPNEHENNMNLATRVMEDIGIPVYLYANEIENSVENVDEKTLLTQLSSAKVVLENPQTKLQVKEATNKDVNVDEKEDIFEYSDEEQNDNFIEDEIAAQRKLDDQVQQINQLTQDYEDARNEVKSQIDERIKIENELSDLTKAYYELKNNFIKERNDRMTFEAELAQEKEANKKLLEEKELIVKSISDVETERDNEKIARIQAESQLESLKNDNSKAEEQINFLNSELESSKNDVQILSHALQQKQQQPDGNERSLKSMQDEIDRLNASLEDAEDYIEEEHAKKEKLKINLFNLTHNFIRLRKHYKHEKRMNDEYRNELQRLNYAFDALMIEKDQESEGRQEAEFEVERLLNEQKKFEETRKRTNQTIRTYSKVIQNMLAKLHKEKEEKKEIEFKNMCLSGGLMTTIKELTESRNTETNAVVYASELEKEVERLSIELDNVEEYIETQKDKKEQLQENLNLLETEFIHLANDFEYEKKAKAEYRAEVKRLVYAFDAVQIEKELETDIAEDAEFEVEELKNALEKAEQKLDETQKRSNETIKTYSKVIQNTLFKLHQEKEARKEAEFENVRLSGALVEAVNEIVDAKGAQNEVDVLEAEVERLSTELENLETYCEVQKEQKENAEEKVQIMQYKMKGLKEEIQDADFEIERLTYALEMIQNYDDSKSESIDKAKYQITNMYSELASAKYSVKKLEQAYEQAQNRINILTHALSESQKRAFERSQAQQITGCNDNEDIIEENEYAPLNDLDLVDQLEAERNARIEAEQQVEKLRAELEQANDDIDMLNESLADTEIERDSLEKSLRKSNRIIKSEKIATREAELQAENLAYNLAMRQASDAAATSTHHNSRVHNKQSEIAGLATRNLANNLETKEQAANDKNINLKEDRESFDSEAARAAAQSDFEGLPVEENNFRLSGRKFGLTMKIDGKTYALTMVDTGDHFLNEGGLKLDLAKPNIKKDPNQQFTFGKDAWNTVIDSFARKGMVWDVANAGTWNPPNGTAFYLYPFHGRHNQHFVLKDDGMIYAKQNGQVVTYVGGNDVPFVMSEPNPAQKETQTFHIHLL